MCFGTDEIMREFTIITDSTCDLSKDIVEKYGIKISPLSIIIDDRCYKNYPDGMGEITNKELYDLMREKKLPTTSGCNSEDFRDVMEAEIKKGKDILYIGFSSAMSCSYNVGCMVAEELQEEYPMAKIMTVDSLCASLGQGLLVMLAAQEQEKGRSLEEVTGFVEDMRLTICHSFTVDDLFHLMRGGRVSKTGAVVGSILMMKPILRLNEIGQIVPSGTVRGRKKAFREVIESIRGNMLDPDMPFLIGHGDCEEEAQQIAELCKQELGLTDVHIGYIGGICGSHCGPGVISFFYLGRSRDAAEGKLSCVS